MTFEPTMRRKCSAPPPWEMLWKRLYSSSGKHSVNFGGRGFSRRDKFFHLEFIDHERLPGESAYKLVGTSNIARHCLDLLCVAQKAALVDVQRGPEIRTEEEQRCFLPVSGYEPDQKCCKHQIPAGISANPPCEPRRFNARERNARTDPKRQD